MANPRELDKRRKSIRNTRKITRTMELIATARFKKAMDRAAAATDYTGRITRLVGDLAHTGLEVSHPLLESRENPQTSKLLVLTANRGYCGGFNGNVLRAAWERQSELKKAIPIFQLEVAGKRGISAFNFRKQEVAEKFTHFEHNPTFDEVDMIAERYLEEYISGKIDRVDVIYTRFTSIARQSVAVETLLPLGSLADEEESASVGDVGQSIYEFLPSAESILEEVVPASFKAKLFKCFLDSAVSEQIARMVAMKSATENADGLIKQLSMQYNRARQSRITSELMDVIGGVEALS